MSSQEVLDEPVVIEAPASKSLSHRYMIGAALADGQSTLSNVLDSEDLEATRRILCEAGARMKPLHDTDASNISGWEVWGMDGKPRGGDKTPLDCDVRESGTTCRLLTAVLAAGEGLFRIHGEGRMHERPIGELCHVLERLGSGIAWQGKEGCPPFLLQAHGLNPSLEDGHARISMDESSQFFSGLLFAAPMAHGPIWMELAGNRAVSWPYVGLTLHVLAEFGIRFQVDIRARIGVPWITATENTWRDLTDARPGCFRVRVWPGKYQAGQYAVEGDWSGASYFLAAGALGKRPVKVTGIRADSLQGDRAIVQILEKMGCRVECEANATTVYPSPLRGVSLDMSRCPDLVPTVAVLASFAQGSTRISNVGHLRLKESDRIAAPAMELAKAGVMVDALSDGLLICGMGGHPAQVRNRPSQPTLPDGVGLSAHNDHRMAMSLALLEMRDPELDVARRLDNAQAVRKSFPRFWDTWSLLK